MLVDRARLLPELDVGTFLCAFSISGLSARRGQLGRDRRPELHPGEEAAVAPEEGQQPGHGHGGQRDQEVRNQGFIEEMTLINTHLILNYMLL